MSLPNLLANYNLVPPIELFALQGSGTNNDTFGVSTGAGSFIAKQYRTISDPAALAYQHWVLARLNSAGLSFRIPTPVTTYNHQTFVEKDGSWLALYPLLPGHPPSRDPDTAEQIGAALTELHIALAHLPIKAHPTQASFGDLDRIHRAVPEPEALQFVEDAAGWWQSELTEMRIFSQTTYRALPHQIVHGDFATGNTLFVDGQLASILDFEFCGPGARAIDVASGAYFILRPWQDLPQWDAALAFCRGYTQHVNLTVDEVEALPLLMRLRNIASVIWRFGQQPAEAASRLKDAQITTAWLERNGSKLVKSIAATIEIRGHETNDNTSLH